MTGWVRGGSVLNFPGTTNGALPSGSTSEAFVARLDNGLNGVTQATYLGGDSSEDRAAAIVLDPNGKEMFVAGFTQATNFSGVASDSAQAVYTGGSVRNIAFVAKLTHGLHDPAHATANNDGEPHITTINGIHYNFQAAGEFTALRDIGGMEIQTRQSPFPTGGAPFDDYTGLTTCVSVNSALAARVGRHRVSYQPNFKNAADPGGLQLRVDGVLTPLTTAGLNLSGGGRIVQTAGALEIDFPDGTVLIAAPDFAGQWLLNIAVYGTEAKEGIMGSVPNGSSVAGASQWRVGRGDADAAASGIAATLRHAQPNVRECLARQHCDQSVRLRTGQHPRRHLPSPTGPGRTVTAPCRMQSKAEDRCRPGPARKDCGSVTGKTRNADCVFDVAATGLPGFAKAYLLAQRLEAGATRITASRNPTPINAQMTFTATVARLAAGGRTPAGTVSSCSTARRWKAGPARCARLGEMDSSDKTWRRSIVGALSPQQKKADVFTPSSSLEKVVVLRGAR